MTLILVKHSNSNHNAHQPSHEWELTQEGRTRCQPLAHHLKPYQPTRLFASNLPRTIQTAQLVAQELDNIPIIENPLLQEHSRISNAPYGTADEFRQKIEQLFAQPDTLIFGDETAHQAQARFSQGIQECLIEATPDENIIVIAHGTVNVLFTALYNPINSFDLWQRLKMPSIIILDLPSYALHTVIEDAGIPPTV